MAKLIGYDEISLDDLVIGRGQARTDRPGHDIEALADSIEKLGLLQPIVVCKAEDGIKWEILTGQRRFLAHKHLKLDKIYAAVLDKRVSEEEAKAISITENLMRRELTRRELTDSITFLYNKYASIKDVVKATGLPEQKVRDHVNYPRLINELKELVDSNTVDINSALLAQDASTHDDVTNTDDAILLAREMVPMSGVQRKRLKKSRKENPEKPVEDVVEDSKTGLKVTQVIVTLSQDTHKALKQVAKEDDTSLDDAATEMIEKSLADRGMFKEQ